MGNARPPFDPSRAEHTGDPSSSAPAEVPPHVEAALVEAEIHSSKIDAALPVPQPPVVIVAENVTVNEAPAPPPAAPDFGAKVTPNSAEIHGPDPSRAVAMGVAVTGMATTTIATVGLFAAKTEKGRTAAAIFTGIGVAMMFGGWLGSRG